MRTSAAAAVLGLGALLAGPAAPAAAATVWPVAAPAATVDCVDAPPATIAASPPALTALAASAAWRTATGRGVTVAVVDSGVDPQGAHLQPAVVPGIDLVGVDADVSGRTDTHGHGTALAGQVAARVVDGSGVVGLAPDATILPVRVYYAADDQAQRDGTGPTTARLAEGIAWAAAHGARVINVSMHVTRDDPALRRAVEEATAAGALVVAAAGTATDDQPDGPRYPAAYDEVLAVTAVDPQGRPTADSVHGPHVDVAAPGADVVTTALGGRECVFAAQAPASRYAAAYASAAAALVVQRHPDETPAQWRFRLEASAARTDPDARDDEVGWGVIRPDVALDLVDDGSVRGPDSPTHPRVAPAAAAPVEVVARVAEDPAADARSTAVWWLLAGLTAVALGVLALRLAGRPGRTGTRERS